MSHIADQQPTHLEAFDRNGVHCGSGRLDASGKWIVKARGMKSDVCDTEQAARNFLQAYGAAIIKESDGRKGGRPCPNP